MTGIFSACMGRICPLGIHHLAAFVAVASVVRSQCDGSQPRGLFEAAVAVLQWPSVLDEWP